MPQTPSSYPLQFGLNNVVAGQFSVTTSAQQLPDYACLFVTIKALAANTVPVYIGGAGVTDSTGLEIDPSSPAVTLQVANLNLLYAVATAAAVISYIVTY